MDGLFFYMIEDRAQNNNMWKKDTTLCNNGVVTIGTCIEIPNAKPIESYITNDIPCVVTMNYVIILESLNMYPTADIQSSVVKIQPKPSVLKECS